MTPSIRAALDDLGLDHVYVAHAGAATFALADKVTAVPAVDLLTGATNLSGDS